MIRVNDELGGNADERQRFSALGRNGKLERITDLVDLWKCSRKAGELVDGGVFARCHGRQREIVRAGMGPKTVRQIFQKIANKFAVR